MTQRFPVWENRQCGTCGAEQEKGDTDPFYKFTCPECSKDGCPECMPAGRGCVCPECEESQ